MAMHSACLGEGRGWKREVRYSSLYGTHSAYKAAIWMDSFRDNGKIGQIYLFKKIIPVINK